MEDPSLEAAFNAVQDENSFLQFLSALAEDRANEVEQEKIQPSPPYSPGANGWQHWSIEDFLEAAAAWGEGSKGGLPLQINGVPKCEEPSNPWKRCAEIIYMGKHYE